MLRSMILSLVGAALLAGCGGSSSAITGAKATTGTTTTTGGTTSGSTATPTVVPASLTAVSSATSIPSNGSTSATITVLARNSSNDLISGVVVAFSADSGGVAVTNATTDTTGSAVATLSTAGDTMPRTITVTATAGGLTATVKVAVVSSNTAATTAVASLTTTSSVPSLLSDGSVSATISALARDGANNTLAGVPVSFAASSGAIAVTTATTDASGVATATLSTGGDSTLRTITVTTTTASLSSTVSVPVTAAAATPVYSIGNGSGSGFTSGIALGVTSLPAGGTTGFTLTIVDQNKALYSAGPVTVTFSSPCIAAGLSHILALGSTTPVTSLSTSTGSLSGTYAAVGCNASDTITANATVAGQNLTDAGTLTVLSSTVGSIQFVSATPATIGLKGTGIQETSTVTFKVYDSTGAPKAGVSVAFALDTVVGGLALSQSSATSATDGTVQAVVSSGTVHTVVRVSATIAASGSTPAFSTESSQLTVTTGLPASAGFSIAVGKPNYTPSQACPNVESYGTDGVIVPVTVFLADRYNNPVPDGTAVAFTTNGGHVDGSCVTGLPTGTPGEGSCVVNWTSANPRPMTTDTPPVRVNGRATILATAVGEESFTDVNGTGFYQSGDPFTNLGEPFLSANETGVYVSGDYFLDFNHNQTYDGPSNPPSFVGITCTGTTPSSTCTTSTLALGVPHLLIMSTSNAVISLVSTTGFTNTGTQLAPSLTIPHTTGSATLVFNVQDSSAVLNLSTGTVVSPGNSMAASTTISSALLSSTTIGSFTQSPGTFTVGCNSDIGGQNISTSFTTTAAGGGTIAITVISPSGSTTVLNIPLTVT